ncbi:MAG: FtsX-like permease family protein, partial [Anaerolineales bacterium]|nr:FtsX-like permease family protein [Anaerolineales bacterium]
MSAIPITTNWPLWRTAWRRMRRRPFQYVLFVLGVALGVAMMVSIDLASGSASRAFQLSTDAIVGKTTHRLLGGPAGLPESVYTDLVTGGADLPLAPIVEGYLLVPELGEQPFRLMGVDPFAEPPFRDYLAASAAADLGPLGTFLNQPNSVIISADVAADYGLAAGDNFTVDNAGKLQTVTIAGLLEPADDIAREALSSLIFSDIATAQEILGLQGQLSHIDLIAPDEAALTALVEQLPPEIRLQAASAGSNTVQQMSAAFDTNLRALSLLALVVGIFLIYNTVTFSVVQRRSLFGILRCLGVTSQQLFQLIIAEALLLSFLGALLGLLLGVILGQGMVRLVTQTINDFYFVVSVRGVALTPWSLLKGLLVGMGAALFASLVPAWEAMRTTPNAGLRRSAIESKSRRMIPWLTAAWLLLTAIGALLLWLRSVSLAFNFAGLFAILIGAALLTPALTILWMRLLARPAGQLFGAIGRMATRDIVRSLSRTAIAIAALMTAVSVIVGVSIMIGSFRGTVTQWLSQTLQADIFVSPPTLTASRVTGTLDPEAAARIAAWDGIDQIVTARQVDVLAPELDRQLKLVASSGDVSNGQRQYAWQKLPTAEMWQAFLNGEGIIVSETLLLQNDLATPPPPLVLETASGQ